VVVEASGSSLQSVRLFPTCENCVKQHGGRYVCSLSSNIRKNRRLIEGAMASHAMQSACGDVNAKAAMLSSCAGDHWNSSSPGFRVTSASLHIYSRTDYGIEVLRDDALHVCIRHRDVSVQQGVRGQGGLLAYRTVGSRASQPQKNREITQMLLARVHSAEPMKTHCMRDHRTRWQSKLHSPNSC
jgi:hypothetical protein